MASTRPAWASETQRDPGQAARDQRAQERQPARPVLSRHHVQAEDLALPVGGDPDRDQSVHDHRPAALADLLGERVQPQECVGAGIQRAGPERLDLRVEALGHLADLRLRQRRNPQLPDELLHPPRRDPQQIAGGHYGDQGLLGAATALQQPLREVTARAQLRDRELDTPGPGVPVPQPIPVAGVHPHLAALPVASTARGVSLGGHQRLRELLHHRPQQIRTRHGEPLVQPTHDIVHTV
jgi:hypothetical protein